MIYEYSCKRCGNFDVVKSMRDSSRPEECPWCGGCTDRVITPPAIHGTRDTFGVGKAFRDEKYGEIDTWKKWEKAGYTDPKDSTRVSHTAKEIMKEKREKLKGTYSPKPIKM